MAASPPDPARCSPAGRFFCPLARTLSRRAGRLLVLAGLTLAAATTPAQPPPSYLGELQRHARELGLARDPLWLALLHVKPLGGFGPQRSLADDADFFNAPSGRTDPQEELDATLAAFFESRLRQGGQPAQCRFRARYEWLRERLRFDALRLPAQDCARYDQWRAGVAGHSLTLVYAAAYINSPASMFGHTLFRLNPPPAPTAQPLLAYSINYAVAAGASPDDWLFEIKGLFGLYPGEFTNAPYYLRVREYSHMEDRDLWEYDLELGADELDRLLAHTWELGYTRFDYWFFDENCSYHLLSLLDAARPSLRLTDGFTWRAVPSDTVKAVAQVPGLVRRRSYRPSATSQILQRAQGLDEATLQQARALARGELAPTQARGDEAQRARTLDLAERHLASLAAQGKLDNRSTQARRMALLGERAKLPMLPEVAVPEPDTAPEAGHGTVRAEGLLGRAAGHDQLRLNVYPAYHELMDPDPGFARGAQIRFFGAGLSLRPGRGPRLDHLVPVDVLSVVPQHTLRDGLSWKISGGWRRAFAVDPAQAPLVFSLNGGPGRSWNLGTGLAYVLMDNQLWWGHSGTRRPWRLGSGVHLGLIADPAAGWRVALEARQRWFSQGARQEQSVLLRQRVQLTPALNAVLHCETSRRRGAAPLHECLAGLQAYW